MSTPFKLKNKENLFDFSQKRDFSYETNKRNFNKSFDYSGGKKKPVDPDAPGRPGTAGFESQVREEDKSPLQIYNKPEGKRTEY